jgi:hypothetical protein
LRNKKHFARRGGLPLAGALIALALGAPTAGAATFGGGSVTLNPSRAFTKQVRFTPTAPATRSGRGVSLPIQSGTSTMSQSNTGSFNLQGGFRLRAGRRRATATACVERLAASIARLTCRFGRRTVALFEQVTTGGKIAPDAAFTGLTGTAIRVRLSRAGASFLNRTLRLSRRASASRRVRPRQAVGTAAVDAVRFLQVSGGTTTTAYDAAFYDKLQSCNIELKPIAPATANPAGPGAPRGSVDLPAGSGTFNARFLATRATARAAQAGVPTTARLDLTGGTRLERANPPYVSDLTNFVQDFSTTPPTLSAFASRFNQTLPIGTLEGAVIRMSLTDTGGSVTLVDGRLVISDLAAQVLSSDTGCALGPNERTIGTSTGTISVT